MPARAKKRRRPRPGTRRTQQRPLTQRQITALAARKWRVPFWILWGVRVTESGTGNDSNTVSSEGAIGPFQFMPSTAEAYGVNPHDFKSSAFGAAHLLRDLKDQYGSWNAALEGYNAGPGNIGQGVGYTTSTIKSSARSTGVTPQNSQRMMVDLITPIGPDIPFPGPDLDFTNPLGPLSPIHPGDLGIPNLQDPLGKGGGGSLFEWPGEMLEAFQQFTKLSKMLSDPQFWVRAAQAIGGMIILYMALKSLTGTGITDVPGGKAASSAAKAAAFKRLPPAQRVR